MLALMLMAAIAASPKAGPAKDETSLVLNIKPAQVVVYLDGRKLGTADKVNTVKVKPGDHTIKLVLKKDSSEDVVTVKKGQKKVWEFDMTDSGDPSQKPKSEGAGTAPAVPWAGSRMAWAGRATEPCPGGRGASMLCASRSLGGGSSAPFARVRGRFRGRVAELCLRVAFVDA